MKMEVQRRILKIEMTEFAEEPVPSERSNQLPTLPCLEEHQPYSQSRCTIFHKFSWNNLLCQPNSNYRSMYTMRNLSDFFDMIKVIKYHTLYKYSMQMHHVLYGSSCIMYIMHVIIYTDNFSKNCLSPKSLNIYNTCTNIS